MPQDFPLSDEEFTKIKNYFSSLNLDTKINLISTDDDYIIGQELGLRFLAISDRESPDDDE